MKFLKVDNFCCVQRHVTQKDTRQTGSVTLLNKATPLMTLYVTAYSASDCISVAEPEPVSAFNT